MLTWPDAADSRLLWSLFIVLVFFATWIGVFKAGPQLPKINGKRPMMAFELAGSVEKAQAVIDSSPDARGQLRTALLWDFLFLFLYPASTAMACSYHQERSRPLFAIQ